MGSLYNSLSPSMCLYLSVSFFHLQFSTNLYVVFSNATDNHKNTRISCVRVIIVSGVSLTGYANICKVCGVVERHSRMSDVKRIGRSQYRGGCYSRCRNERVLLRKSGSCRIVAWINSYIKPGRKAAAI